MVNQLKSTNTLKWLLISQSVALFGSSLVFPFYVIFLSDTGASFSEFGIAYGLFTLSAAGVHHFVGKSSDHRGRKIFLLLHSWGVSVLFLIFPLVTAVWQIYVLQILLGIFGAMQKTSEKALIGDFTDGLPRGKTIGAYHAWVAIFSGLAIMASGYIIDFLTIEVIFYVGSLFLFMSGFFVFKIKEYGEE